MCAADAWCSRAQMQVWVAVVIWVLALMGSVDHVPVHVGTICCMDRGLFMCRLWEPTPTLFFGLFLILGFVGQVFLWLLGPATSCFIISSDASFSGTEFSMYSTLIYSLELVPVYFGHCLFEITYGYIQEVHLYLAFSFL